MPAQDSTSRDDDAQGHDVEQPESTETNNRLLSRYLSHLRGHAAHTRLHLAGSSNPTHTVTEPAFIAPNSYWTAEEKNAFFHALAVHSRLRPDLIAEEVRTKTFADVCTYLNILEDGLTFYRHENTLDVPSTETFTPITRDELPIAHEVTEKWIDFEDEYSEALFSQERTFVKETIWKAREDEVKRRRDDIRAPRGGGRRADNTRDREGEKARRELFKEWHGQAEAKWAKEDVLGAMDMAIMKAVDSLVRESENTQSHTSQQLKEANITQRNTAQAIDASAEQVDDTPDTPSTPQLALPNTMNPPSLSGSRSPPGSSTAVESNPAEDGLSPASRRRALKRIYMRRRRAGANGGVVNESTGRLKRGRRPLRRADDDSEDDEGTPVDDATSSSRRSEADVRRRHPHPSGKTLPYKTRERLDSAGITSKWLVDEGFDLFHMASLTKLMQTYNSLHDESDIVASELAVDVVQQLRKEVVCFTSEVVRRAITSKEQDIVSKMHTKAWRLGQSQLITPANVAHALSVVGAELTTKKAHFSRLVQETDFASDVSKGSNEEDEEPSGVSPKGKGKGKQKATDEPVETMHPITGTTPLHRVLFPPFVRLPVPSIVRTAPYSVTPYMSWPPLETPKDPSIELEGDSEIDEDALAKELLEEEDFDEVDRQADTNHEEKLWAEFDAAHDPPAELVYEDSEDDGPQRKRRKTVKTAEFVVDSDDEMS